MAEGVLENIPHKVGDAVYSVYTDYEKDHTKPYTTILGCKVTTLAVIPNEMVGITIASTYYQKFVAKGNLAEGVVYKEWTKIWNSEINRAYTADFEIYDEHSKDPSNAHVHIYIALK